MVRVRERSDFHILTVGWGLDVIRCLADRVQGATGFRFSHILDPLIDPKVLEGHHVSSNCFLLREGSHPKMPLPDPASLASLEGPGIPTIHNMIMSDRVLRLLSYEDSLAYATYLAGRLEHLFRRIDPSVIIGGYDGIHSGIGLAVARKLGIPWFALSFTSIPRGRTGYCTGMDPGTVVPVCRPSEASLRTLAEQTLAEFEAKRLVAPSYLSANSAALIIRRLPGHVRAFYGSVRQAIANRYDKYTQYAAGRLAMEYIRKRMNILLLPNRWFLGSPPSAPYLFIGLHMQPESSIDVWAPFFSDQFGVIESIARATPPTHRILVKLHHSDADNYSRRQLRRLMRLPGVRLVSPFTSSRVFIESASLVLAIQGNIGLEAALLGRPVLMFGDSKFMEFPSVSKVKRVTDLPMQIREKLSEAPPKKEAILQGLMSYLSGYGPGCYNNWDISLSETEIEALAGQFMALRDHVEGRTVCAE